MNLKVISLLTVVHGMKFTVLIVLIFNKTFYDRIIQPIFQDTAKDTGYEITLMKMPFSKWYDIKKLIQGDRL